jgi:hypothetical protein
MHINEHKALAIKTLNAKGANLAARATQLEICAAIGIKPTNAYKARQIICDYLGVPAYETKAPINPAYQRPFIAQDPEKVRKHDRHADIDRDQPPMTAMRGIGNGKQPGGFAPMVW